MKTFSKVSSLLIFSQVATGEVLAFFVDNFGNFLNCVYITIDSGSKELLITR